MAVDFETLAVDSEQQEHMLVLYQPSLILTRFTAAIFAASQERVAPRCPTPQATRDAAGDKKRPALAGGAHRPAGCVAALARCPASRRPPRLPGGPMCPMKRVNIKDGWYKRVA